TEHRAIPRSGPVAAYEFTAAELAKLCRWYSAMKYAFPQIQGVMTVSHKEKVSAVGLYGRDGTTPNCLISKHETDERVYLLWATDPDPPRVIASISEITDAQIIAIEPPRNESSWLDVVGWMKVLASRTVGGHLDTTELSSNPA
ncbi:MAG: hypothetical protein ACRDRL_30335, partial [Sciscionella sp.]